MDTKRSIYDKLAAIQSELKVGKGQYNNFGGYAYRSAEDILAAAKPACKRHSAVVICQDEMAVIGGRIYLQATATLHSTDDDGTVTVTAYAREADTKKGTSPEQLTGMASSYARKYALQGLFGLSDPKADPDTTENAKAEAATQARADRKEVEMVIKAITERTSPTPVEQRLSKTAERFGVSSLYDLTSGQLENLKTKLGM